MGRIPEATLEAITQRASIVDVVGRYVKLKRQGRQMVGLCPFHSERTPSFSVNPEQGLYYCFGCQAGGSLFNFVMEIEGLSFPQAVKKLGEEVGIEVEFNEEETDEQRERKRLLELLERTTQFYHEMLLKSPLGKPALRYCEERGLELNTIEKFRLGWAPESGNALAKKLPSAGYTPTEGVEAGVLRERGGHVVDTLRGRLVFPILDAQGRALAFGGRVLGQGTPKYLNTPETELYAKRRHLFGLATHRGAISRAEKAVVVEGYLDVIAMSQVGVPLGVASLGTALTEEQTQLLARYARDVILAYDADRAGESATLKAIELFEKVGLRVSVAPLEQGQDPDSLARSGGAEAVERCLDSAVSVIEFLMARAERRLDLSTPEGKQDFAREVLPAIGRIQDSTRRDGYLASVASKLRVSETQLGWKLQSNLTASRPAQGGRRRSRLLDDTEKMLLRICALEPKWISQVKSELELSCFRPDFRRLFGVIYQLEGKEEPISLQELLPGIEDQDMVAQVAEILAKEPLSTLEEDVQKHVHAINIRLKKSRLEELSPEVVSAINAGTLDPADEKYQEYRRLQQQLKGVR